MPGVGAGFVLFASGGSGGSGDGGGVEFDEDYGAGRCVAGVGGLSGGVSGGAAISCFGVVRANFNGDGLGHGDWLWVFRCGKNLRGGWGVLLGQHGKIYRSEGCLDCFDQGTDFRGDHCDDCLP